MKKSDVLEPAHLVTDLQELRLPAVVEHWERLAAEAVASASRMRSTWPTSRTSR